MRPAGVIAIALPKQPAWWRGSEARWRLADGGDHAHRDRKLAKDLQFFYDPHDEPVAIDVGPDERALFPQWQRLDEPARIRHIAERVHDVVKFRHRGVRVDPPGEILNALQPAGWEVFELVSGSA